MILIKNQYRRTGEERNIYRLVDKPADLQNIKDAASLLLHNGISISGRIEGEFYSEEWAKGDLLVDVCTDDQENFINRKELEFTPYPNSQYWITEEEPSRVRDVNVFIESNDGRYLALPVSDWR